MRRKAVPIVLPSLVSPPQGADHVAVKYGHGYRADDDEQPRALTARDDETPAQSISAAQNTLCAWPSSKSGTKPQLLAQLEAYLHQQHTLLHRGTSIDREAQIMIRCDIARHCLREFENHFKIYRDIFATLGHTVEAVTLVFDDHRQQIEQLLAFIRDSKDENARLIEEMAAQQRKFEKETKEYQTLSSRLQETDEDRKVLRALADELTRQVQKLRSVADAAQDRTEAMSRQHVLLTMRDERQRVKLEQTELALSELQSKLLAAERDRSTLRMRVEILEVELARITRESDNVRADNGQLAAVINSKDEEIRMLRFEQRRRMVTSSGPNPVDNDTRNNIAAEVESRLKKSWTPRPEWESKLSYIDPLLRSRPTDSSDTTVIGAISAVKNTPAIPMDVTASSITAQQHSTSVEEPPAARSTALTEEDDHEAPIAPPTISTRERVGELCTKLSDYYERVTHLEEMNAGLSKKVMTLETLTAALVVPNEWSPDGSVKSPKAAAGAKVAHRPAAATIKPPKATAVDVFVPLGTDPIVVPPYLRAAPGTARSIAVRPMSIIQTLRHIQSASQFISLWLADMDPEPATYDRHQGIVSRFDRGPSFTDGFTEWLIYEYKVRRKDPDAGRELPPAASVDFPPESVYTGDGLAEFSLELSYSLVHHCTTFAAQSNVALCRMFLLCLAGEIPRDTIARFFSRMRTVERLFEDTDTQCTGGIFALEAAHALRTALPDLGSHHIAGLAEIIDLERNLKSSPHSRIPFRELLMLDCPFVQCMASFFLESVEYHIVAVTSAVLRAAGAQPEITSVAFSAALQAADPYADPEAIRLYVTRICRAQLSKASRVIVADVLSRLKEVFYQRRTPVEFGQLSAEKRLQWSLPQLEVRPAAVREAGATGRTKHLDGIRAIASSTSARVMKPVEPQRHR